MLTWLTGICEMDRDAATDWLVFFKPGCVLNLTGGSCVRSVYQMISKGMDQAGCTYHTGSLKDTHL